MSFPVIGLPGDLSPSESSLVFPPLPSDLYPLSSPTEPSLLRQLILTASFTELKMPRA